MARAQDGDIKRRVDAAGRVWFSGDDAAELLLRGYDIAALHLDVTPDIEVYNHWCVKMDKRAFAVACTPPDEPPDGRLNDWWLIPPFDTLPVRETLLARCETESQRQRVALEMDLFEARDLLPVLRLMFQLVAHFRQHNIVWGVGRGSSVSSFCLYLIGIHKINSLKYDLDITEFLRD